MKNRARPSVCSAGHIGYSAAQRVSVKSYDDATKPREATEEEVDKLEYVIQEPERWA